jgi:hypothetical protein
MCAATTLSGLLLIASVAPASARSDGARAASAAAGTASGTSMASAPEIRAQTAYTGTIARKQEAWYSFEAGGGPRAFAKVWSPPGSCPVSVAVVDAHGTTLGQLITSTREKLPLLAYFPAREVSETYYLKVGSDPFVRCASARYALYLEEPGQPEPSQPTSTQPEPCAHGAPAGSGSEACSSYEHATEPSKEAVEPFHSGACRPDKKAFEEAREIAKRYQEQVERRRGSRALLAHLRAVESADNSKMNVVCNI